MAIYINIPCNLNTVWPRTIKLPFVYLHVTFHLLYNIVAYTMTMIIIIIMYTFKAVVQVLCMLCVSYHVLIVVQNKKKHNANLERCA